MFEIITLIVFIWLMAKVIGLAWRMTWGAAKLAASILMAIAVPVLFVGWIFAGGVILLVPLALIGIAFGILKSFV